MGRLFVKLAAAGMESRFRSRFFNPEKILKGADVRQDQHTLEFGCGIGFFTIPAARWVGEQGCLVAMDI